ncbi:MAG: SUMF1/EgtB/PvdO family nonheme iron enzyme [Bacteroidales bacterium]|jgi:formylglycine-generating enzyme required for sulfatase activity/nitrate/TMAO reductase-like tetraheme cytochrome c subunit|nr:SUMF1/EgtB/PvdO family nonheme iron enzyme [Bacteroidales bacterium]
MPVKRKQKRTIRILLFAAGIGIAAGLQFGGESIARRAATDDYCMSCHVHTHADEAWKLSTHYDNASGITVHCVDCHLPSEGHGRLRAQVKRSLKDRYALWTKDSADFRWEEKRKPENAHKFVYQDACLRCHTNLFPTTQTKEGDDAHLNFLNTSGAVSCINCHLNVGHFDPTATHEHNYDFAAAVRADTVYTEATPITAFADYTEQIPGTAIRFDMVAVAGGEFMMGSSDSEPLRRPDEGPVTKVKLSPFFIGRIEVSWDEYLAFFAATSSQGRKESEAPKEEVDGISGPTPPWGAPDQGWGRGQRPAITMSWHAANTYCRWLSQVTGKRYRLPTEAEWEYACRGGTQSPYPFAGSPKKYSNTGFFRKIVSADTAIISRYAIYAGNSNGITHEPSDVLPNPLGIKNMLGNVAEFCLDRYDPNTYATYKGEVENPHGSKRGAEHVVRGGSFRSDAKDLRCAARDYTRTQAWLVTDPQMPKSIWWYSDTQEVGFRVVCEY